MFKSSVASVAALAMLAAAGCTPRPTSVEERMADLLVRKPSEGQIRPRSSSPTGEPTALGDRAQRETYIERGGLRIRSGGETPPVGNGAADGVQLNFPNTDVREFAGAVLGGILGLNYAVDSRIEGTVTLETQGQIPRDQVLPLVEQVLLMHGAALVPIPGGYQVVPSDRTVDFPVSLDAGAGIGVQIVPLQNLSAETAAQLLGPFAQGGTSLVSEPRLNALLIAGPGSRTEALAKLLRSMDVDRLRGLSIALHPLRYAAPDALVAELSQIFDVGEEGTVRLVPLQRLGAVAIVTRDAGQLDRVLEWTRRLDQEGGGDQPELFVYRAQNVRAADLAGALGQIYGAGPGSPQNGQISPGDTARRTRVSTSGFGSQAGGRGAGIGGQPAGGATMAGGGMEGLAGQTGTAEGTGLAGGGGPLASAGTDMFAGGDAPVSAFGAAQTGTLPGNMRIIADEGRNAVVVYATRQQYRNIERALTQLDQIPLQVMIEATIAEVTLEDELAYGLQWFFQSGNFQAVLSQTAGTNIVPALPGSAAIFNGGDARAVLSALSSITEVRVISSPQVLALTNQMASLQVGDSVPIPVQQAVNLENPDGVIVNSIEFIETGVTLEVVPRVNDGGMVMLDIVQNVSEAGVTLTSGIDAPTISQRRIASSVAVRSGQTIGLGGLIRDRTSRSREGVPILSSLPAIGALFSTRRTDSRRTELLVLLTPRVIATDEDARLMTDELRMKMLSMQPPGGLPLPAAPVIEVVPESAAPALDDRAETPDGAAS